MSERVLLESYMARLRLPGRAAAVHIRERWLARRQVVLRRVRADDDRAHRHARCKENGIL